MNEKTVLLEYNGVKKAIIVQQNMKEKMDFLNLFEFSKLKSLATPSYISLQRYDNEWGEFLDIDVNDIQNKDKLQIKIIKNQDQENPPGAFSTLIVLKCI